jgi:hypothetical protein
VPESYLAVRRAAGFTLRNAEYLLRSFASFDLWAWLNNPMEGPPAARQLAEQLPIPLIW